MKSQLIPVLQDVADEMDVGYGRWIHAGAVNGFSAVNDFTAHSQGNFWTRNGTSP